MPEPAGTGLSRRKFLSRSAGPGARRLRRLEDPALGLRDRDRPGGAGATRSSSRSSSTAASTRSACSPRSATRATRSCGRTWRWRPGAGTDLQRGPAPAAGTRPPPAWRPCTARARSAPSRRSATTTPTSRTSPRATTTRSASSTVGFRTGWLGRYIDAVGDDDNPLQGLSMDGSLSPMIATAEKPVAAIDSVDGYDLWSRGRRPGRRPRCSRASPASARCRPTRRRWPRCAARPPRPTSCARNSAGSATSPARSPTRTPTSPTSSPGSPPTSPSGCRCGW